MHRRELLNRAAGLAALGIAPRAFARPRPLKVGVVGGGIVGASIAMHLAQAGANVTLFEKTAPASGATQNSFAWVNAFVPDAHYRTLRIQSLLAYHMLDQPLGLAMTWGGYVNWGSTIIEAETVRANAQQLAGTPYGVRPLNAEELAALNPSLVTGPVTAAFLSAVDGHLNPVYVTGRFLRRAAQLGATVIYPCEVRNLTFRSQRLSEVDTSRGKFAVDRLVVAAGVDTPRILAMAGFALALKHAPGILAHSLPLQPLTGTVYDAPGGLSFKQMTDGSVVGTDAPNPPDTAVHRDIRDHEMQFPDEALRAYHGNRILSKIGVYLPGARGVALERLTLGFRPMPMDELPVVGALPTAADVHVAVTHSGVTLAPIVGQYTSDEVLNASRTDILAPYRPERFTEVQVHSGQRGLVGTYLTDAV
jgi:glycine/D-amino acid oxidase-like deaminating enzyme